MSIKKKYVIVISIMIVLSVLLALGCYAAEPNTSIVATEKTIPIGLYIYIGLIILLIAVIIAFIVVVARIVMDKMNLEKIAQGNFEDESKEQFLKENIIKDRQRLRVLSLVLIVVYFCQRFVQVVFLYKK